MPLVQIISPLLQVSRTHEIIESLMDYERDIMSGNLSPSDIVAVILSVNSVIEVWPAFLTYCRYLLNYDMCTGLVLELAMKFVWYLIEFLVLYYLCNLQKVHWYKYELYTMNYPEIWSRKHWAVHTKDPKPENLKGTGLLQHWFCFLQWHHWSVWSWLLDCGFRDYCMQHCSTDRERQMCLSCL